MEQSEEAMPIPDAAIMKRLGYVRLLFDQAVSQSYAPPPLDFSSVLAFHDVMEFFFVIAVDHAGGNQDIDLKNAFVDNAKKLRSADGTRMSCLDAVNRIGLDRNGFKHNGSIPGPDQIEGARRGATRFLEMNCPRFFGVDFDDISMLHIVTQDDVRARLTAARAAADVDDLHTAMAEVAIAFHQLLSDWGHGKRIGSSRETLHLSPYQDHRSRRSISPWYQARDNDANRAISALVSSVISAFEETDKELATLRRVLRVQVAGLDMARYARFSMLTPDVNMQRGGELYAVHLHGQYHYSAENYDFCEAFVVDSALRLGATDFNMWMPETFGDVKRAEEAMEANGGKLPEGWK
jgi:hypothetical protein